MLVAIASNINASAVGENTQQRLSRQVVFFNAQGMVKQNRQSEEEFQQRQKIEFEYQTNYFKQIELACKSVYNNCENKLVAELGKIVWALYFLQGSLRKTLAALPEHYMDMLDFKTVHLVVLNYQQTIKDYLDSKDIF